jgi:RNA polymerase sigma-70 factor, ECF subfamily
MMEPAAFQGNEEIGASDAELLAASDRDPEAFGRLYDRHVRVLLAYVHALTRSPETTADIVAETFAKAFVARRRFHDLGGSARPWLFKIAKNELLMLERRRRVEMRAARRLGIERPVLDDTSIERIEEFLDSASARAAVRDAMKSLSPKIADAVQLRVVRQLPYTEVARLLGCSVRAARTRVFRGLNQLYDEMEVRV